MYKPHAIELAGMTVEATALARIRIETLAEIKAATEAFDRGEVNASDTLDTIVKAATAYGDGLRSRRGVA